MARRDGGPAGEPGRCCQQRRNSAARSGTRVTHYRVANQPVSQAVADRLWRLHWDHGYFTRAEIDAALGLDPPRGEWACPGQFGADGRWAPCCGRGSAA